MLGKMVAALLLLQAFLAPSVVLSFVASSTCSLQFISSGNVHVSTVSLSKHSATTTSPTSSSEDGRRRRRYSIYGFAANHCRQHAGRLNYLALHSSLEQVGQEETRLDNSTADSSFEPDDDDFESLPAGMPQGFYIVKEYKFPEATDNRSVLDDCFQQLANLNSSHIDRLELSPTNVSLPVALMILDADEYPSLSRARKACRKGNVLVVRRHEGVSASLSIGCSDDQAATNVKTTDRFIGRVGDRVYPGDAVCKQVRMGSGYFPVLGHKKPPFDLPVIYEDDHFALVKKPAGVVVYRQGSGQNGLMSVRAALPFVLKPPKKGTYSVLRRPASVHRLDKPTSGLLCVAKTKPAMLNLSRQFHDRIVKKTYMAVVNGIPEEVSKNAITSKEAAEVGADIDPSHYDDDIMWQLIDSPLDGKNAVTVWRAVRYTKSLHAFDGYLTLVELKPKTGRYHQLRRHMAWVCNRPLVGDGEYDEGTEQAMKFRGRGLFLCASRVTHEHPYFNSKEGRQLWDELDANDKLAGGKMWLSVDDRVMVGAEIDLPNKFNDLLAREVDRFLQLSNPAASSAI